MAGVENKIGLTDEVSYTSNKFINDQSHIGWKTVIMDSTARDSGATPTTTLREGLVLGEITAQNTYKEYDDSDNDGSEVADLILAEQVDLVDPETNAAADSTALCVYQARVENGSLIGIDANGRTDLAGRIVFDNV